MDGLKDLRVGTRLGAAFAVLLGLMLVMAGVGALLTKAINDHAEYYPNNILPSLRTVRQVEVLVSDMRRDEQQHILTEDDKLKKSLANNIVKARDALRQRFKDYELLVDDAEDRALLKQTEEAATAYIALQDKVLKASDESAADPTQGTAAREMSSGDGRKAHVALQQLVNRWWDHNEKLAGEATDKAEAAYRRVLMIFAGAATLAVALGVLAAVTITRSITGPVRRAGEAVRAVAAGDLTQRLQAESRDELGQLLSDLDDMTQNLARMVAGVRQGCDQLNVAASEIAQGNADLSARTESQASSLEETAASVEEMAAQIKANADNARQADQLASKASEVAGAGGAAVGEVVATMDAISASSRKIADIIGVIDGIAFQTNILALNAAVEAARAGEQGRGFAVVAGEVRQLAHRSAEAAKEIKSLIGDSVTKVESGSAQVLSARETIAQMVNEVRKVTDLVAEITVSSREQSEGVGQINAAVSQLDQATQQNAALVEQTAAAAESMRMQTAKLSEAVSVFRVDASLGGAGRAASAPAAPRPGSRSGSRAGSVAASPAAPRPSAAATHAKASRPAPAPSRPVAVPPAEGVSAAAPRPAAAPSAAPAAEGDWETF